jgi:hypothetical protein
MLRGFKRVRNRIAVLPTMAANPVAPEASRHAEPARSAREDAAKSLGRTSRSSTSDGFGPTPARATDKLATAPPPKGDKPAVPASNKPRPWRRRLTTWTTLALRGGGCPKSL